MKQHIARIIHARRRAMRLTQAGLAARLGVSRALVSQWETGRCVPQAQHLGVLGLESDELQETSVKLNISRPAKKRALRPLYPIGATLEQMLRLGYVAREIHADATRVISRPELETVVDHYARDSGHELLFAFHLMRQGARPVLASPMEFGCPLHVLDDFELRAAGAERQIALRRGNDDERMHVYGQVTLRGSSPRPKRVDFLIYYKRRNKRGHWLYVELDGSDHAWTPNQDAAREALVGIPEIRYDNALIRSPHFFERLMKDVRTRAEVSAEWDAERRRKGRAFRRKREEEASARRAA